MVSRRALASSCTGQIAQGLASRFKTYQWFPFPQFQEWLPDLLWPRWSRASRKNTGVHGNPGWSSSIKGVVKHEEDLRTLEQSTRVLERTWNKLAAVRLSLRWQKLSLGEIQNWSSRVYDWRHGLGGLVLDYPTELTVASIYSRQERWPLNRMTTCGGRRSGRSLAQGIRGIYRGSPHQRWSDVQNESRRCGECAQLHGARPWIRCHRRAHPKRPWQHGTVAGVNCWSEDIYGDDIYSTPSVIQSIRSRITAARARIYARLIGGEVLWTCSPPFTVPWHNFFSWPDSLICRAWIFIFHVMTWLSFFKEVVARLFSFNLAIAIIAK
jgi:hypothetical protein